ncbi:MAG: putative malate transporter YflS [Gemmatimonadaceae bacterium]|nr:putative malate transporter YflS [Gemmatimonadaceae bacterium]
MRPSKPEPEGALWRWAIVIGTAVLILLAPLPDGITPASWRLLAIFTATIVGSIARPAPASSIVLFGVTALALTGTMTPTDALKGYADPIVWMVLCAFFISRAVIRTGLGRRIAFLFIRALGRRSLGLSYALVSTDALLASFVPSNGARAGGVIFPVTDSLADAYESHPGPTRRRLGAFLMVAVYQSDVVCSTMYLTGQASNVLIAKFAAATTGIELTYTRWIVGGIVPGIASLLLVPLVIYKLFPPDVTHTPHATEIARAELARMGPMSRDERVTMAVFALVAGLWMTMSVHRINYAVVALFGVCVLLAMKVLSWDEVVGEKPAWDVFIWYGGLVRMAEALGETGLTKRFAELTAGYTSGMAWGAALAILLLVYFYAHYGFASITAHATAMYTPFLVVVVAAGAPPLLAVLMLAYFSNLSACLTHYGTTPAPIYFGAHYTTQREWWRLGFIVSLVTISVWTVLGLGWWKVLGWY